MFLQRLHSRQITGLLSGQTRIHLPVTLIWQTSYFFLCVEGPWEFWGNQPARSMYVHSYVHIHASSTVYKRQKTDVFLTFFGHLLVNGLCSSNWLFFFFLLLSLFSFHVFVIFISLSLQWEKDTAVKQRTRPYSSEARKGTAVRQLTRMLSSEAKN